MSETPHEQGLKDDEELLIFDRSDGESVGCALPELDVPPRPVEELLPADCIRKKPAELPTVPEWEVLRHYVRLSQRNFGVDSGFYPLGSCTMKHNPRAHEEAARERGFACLHPLIDDALAQGALRLMFELERFLAEIGGMDAVSLQPPAGAAGELASLLCFRAYHLSRGEEQRTRVLVPDSSHGTNPASAARCGWTVHTIPSDERGLCDLRALEAELDDTVAAFMLTNPNTLGLFEEHAVEICRMVHEAGGQVYCDGANMNALLGIARPGDMGFDAMHFNLHKTFSTPHGGGGPGSGPIAVKRHLEPFLPIPRIARRPDGMFYLDDDRPQSIGRVHGFYGNFAVIVRAYAYILSHGPEGLKQVAQRAVLNANYLLHALREYYDVPYDRRCMHEFVLSADRQAKQGCRAIHIAKRLMDFGFHPPTIYFPLIVSEALMIEPTETESKRTLDQFIAAMRRIAEECERKPEVVRSAPHRAYAARVDEARAARELDLQRKLGES